MKRTVFFLTILYLCGCATISPTPNLFGIKMNNENTAKNFHIQSKEGRGYKFTYEPRTMDPQIKAEGRFEWRDQYLNSLLLLVKNESNAPFFVAYTLDEFKLVTKDGREIKLVKQSGMMSKEYRVITPHSEQSYYLGIPVAEHLTADDVDRVICTFGADQDKIILMSIPKGEK